MRPIAILALFIGVLSLGCSSKTDSAKPGDVAKNVQGRWKVVSFEVEGKEMPAEKLQTFEVLVEGDTIKAFNKGEEIKSENGNPTFKLDVSTSPMSVDFTIKSTALKYLNGKAVETKEVVEQTAKGIFEVNGDTIKLCINFPERGGEGLKVSDTVRPASFTPVEKKEIAIMELKRVK